MRTRLTWAVLFSAAIIVTTVYQIKEFRQRVLGSEWPNYSPTRTLRKASTLAYLKINVGSGQLQNAHAISTCAIAQ